MKIGKLIQRLKWGGGMTDIYTDSTVISLAYFFVVVKRGKYGNKKQL
jgi:hypothetical protein